MAYELSFQDDKGLLIVEISGIREKNKLTSSAKEVWREIARVTRVKKVKRVLILSSATGDYPALDALLINSSLAECGVQREWDIAFVNLDQASFQEVKFAETVAVNRGFNIGVFNNENDARKWLLKST